MTAAVERRPAFGRGRSHLSTRSLRQSRTLVGLGLTALIVGVGGLFIRRQRQAARAQTACASVLAIVLLAGIFASVGAQWIEHYVNGVFAAMIILAGMALVAEYVITLVENRLVRWKPTQLSEVGA